MKAIQSIVSAVVLWGAGELTTYGQNIKSDIGSQLAEIRQNTAKYHQVARAVADGYGAVMPGSNAGAGGPDFIYGNWAAVLDGELRLDQPEALGYVRLPNGKLRLASVYFFVPFVEAGEPAPLWLGHEMVANESYGFWEMEVWLWFDNPDGIFEFYNPRCDEDAKVKKVK